MEATDIIKTAGIHAAADDPDTAHLVIGLNRVVSSNLVDGLDVEPQETDEGVNILIRVRGGVVIKKPVHMCFGLLQEEGIQEINIDLSVGDGARVGIMAHCVFPNAADRDGRPTVRHLMNARLDIGDNAEYSYIERHIHSDRGGVLVVPRAVVNVGRGSRFRTDFELVRGRVGKIDIDYETTVGPRSVMEMTAKVNGRDDDKISIRETGYLVGEHSRGALTTRVAARDRAVADVYNKLTASAAFARGHVDCKEIITGEGKASATPIVEVSHPRAHVTHEAAIGSVDAKQLQTLMARGLDEDAAGDLIIEGLLS